MTSQREARDDTALSVSSGAMSNVLVLRWYPVFALAAMVVLGVIVRPASTSLDDWFIRTGRAHPRLDVLLWFTDPRLLLLILAVSGSLALYRRRWRLAAVVALTPLVALAAVKICKPLFGREKEGALAYPSGHVTVTIVATGMAVLVAGATLRAMAAASLIVVPGLFGQAFTHHYFTDTIGALLLGTAVVVIALFAAELDRCQPRCDLGHSSG